MTDHPLLFRDEMVRALLEGRKTQTRRPAWGAEFESPVDGDAALIKGWAITVKKGGLQVYRKPTAAQRIAVGDLVWVRETFDHRPGVVVYRADGFSWHLMPGAPVWPIGKTPNFTLVWQSSTRMPRRYSRLTLAVTGARVERVQAISEADAMAEAPPENTSRKTRHQIVQAGGAHLDSYRDDFRALYCRIHGHDAWAANPEVVVLTFTVHNLNIDAFKKREAA